MKLQIENLSFSYRRDSEDVVKCLNASFEAGEVVGLLGPNGAGKSTLLYLIAGALTPSSGSVDFNGISTRLRKPSVLSEIYLVAEEADLPRMSLDEYVALYSVFYPNFNHEVMEEALLEFNMERPQRIDQLSMGQKKKILLSFAFACNTAVVLLDEPTNGLDIPGKAAFRRLVARLASDERLFLISTHQVRDLDTILDRVMIMDTRQIVFNETLPEIQRKFVFVNAAGTVPDNALYTLRVPGGVDYIMPNDSDVETDVNLELLFGAVMQHPGFMKTIN